jgi:SecD/SecF fusion protein
VLLLVLLLIGLAAVTIVAKKTRLGLDLKGGVELVYQAKPTAQSKVDSESLERAINIMRKRVDQLGVAQPEIQRSGGEEIDVALPDVSNATRAQEEVGKTAQLYFYDWEPNVIGPTGEKAPTEGAVTGDSTINGAGGVSAGLPEYQAVLRAAKRPAILRSADTTWTPGCTAAQLHDCIYGSWYLLDTKHEKVLRGPEETEHNLYTDLGKLPAGAKLKAVRVNPGTVLLQATPVESVRGKVTNRSPNSWYVVNDNPLLRGSDITNPTQSNDESTGQPNVTFGFTSHGQGVFERVTKEIAHRGQEAQLPGVSKEAAQQHFAVALDGQLITVPSIDFTKYPEGIDASTGSEISGGFTITTAQNLANELQSGALPIRLALISRSQVSATLANRRSHRA